MYEPLGQKDLTTQLSAIPQAQSISALAAKIKQFGGNKTYPLFIRAARPAGYISRGSFFKFRPGRHPAFRFPGKTGC